MSEHSQMTEDDDIDFRAVNNSLELGINDKNKVFREYELRSWS